MLTSAGPINSPLTSQDHDWDPVVFVPLDESTAYEQLDAYFEREAAKRALAEAAGIDNVRVIDALMEAGFRPETLTALQLAPIAFAAWASDSVTDAESRAAVSSIYEYRLLKHPAAACCVQSWLDVRPDQQLWDLWVRYTQCRLQDTPAIERRVVGKQLLEQATAVALASGGFLGIGKICAAEQVVLDGIQNVYRL
ncbi:MAG: hypothetical protein AB8B91_06855 [Rubripirellula sp.]